MLMRRWLWLRLILADRRLNWSRRRRGCDRLVVRHALLERLYAFGYVAHQLRHFTTTEQKHHDNADNDPVPNANASHDLSPINV
jgi:hypothetical protein